MCNLHLNNYLMNTNLMIRDEKNAGFFLAKHKKKSGFLIHKFCNGKIYFLVLY